jgi:hypothetical protein
VWGTNGFVDFHDDIGGLCVHIYYTLYALLAGFGRRAVADGFGLEGEGEVKYFDVTYAIIPPVDKRP